VFLANRNPVKDRACNCQILLKKQEGLGEKMKDGMKKEISQVRDKKDKTANKAKQVSLDKKVRVVKGCKLFWNI
jgi:hypothetical protein